MGGPTVAQPALPVMANRPVDLRLTDMVTPGGIMGGALAERQRRKCPGA